MISFDSALSKVRALLDRADHPNTPGPEADACRAKAEHLMREYRIEEEQALAQDPQVMAPELGTISVCPMDSEYIDSYYSLIYWIAKHVGIRTKVYYDFDKGTCNVRVVGYASDIKFAELIYTSARMVFSEHLEPTKDEALSDAENVYRMRRAGMERNRIAQIMWGSAMTDGKAHGKVGKMYRDECARRGEDAILTGRGTSAKLYREQYAKGFTSRMYTRLQKAKEGADRIGGLPALHGRQERVDEKFYELYPELRPSERKDAEESKSTKKQKPLRWTKKDQAALDRRTSSTARAATMAGSSAADKVALDGSNGARLDRYTAQEREDTRQIWAAIEGH